MFPRLFIHREVRNRKYIKKGNNYWRKGNISHTILDKFEVFQLEEGHSSQSILLFCCGFLSRWSYPIAYFVKSSITYILLANARSGWKLVEQTNTLKSRFYENRTVHPARVASPTNFLAVRLCTFTRETCSVSFKEEKCQCARLRNTWQTACTSKTLRLIEKK